MNSGRKYIQSQIDMVLAGRTSRELEARLSPDNRPVSPSVPGGAKTTESAITERWALLQNATGQHKAALLDPSSCANPEIYSRNIEGFIGTLKVPVGLAGPLRVNGAFASGDFYIPLATTEAAMVASYSRGAQVISEAGGCASLLVSEAISRAPGFVFDNLRESGLFVLWLTQNLDDIRKQGEATTQHGHLVNIRVNLEGNHVYVNFEFQTGDAAGQNMVTIATQAMFDFILLNSPIKPLRAYVEANHSGDKKASIRGFILGRGRKVSAEVVIPAELVKKRLHATVEQMAHYTALSSMGGVLSGTIGVQGHYANGLAGLYLATGMDVACVAESSVGVTRMEVRPDGSLYASATLPNLIVGTVGGGTGLPTQNACLNIMGLSGQDKARAFAEVAAGLCLAGELSIIAALASGEFSRAHSRLARGKRMKKSANSGQPDQAK